MTEPKAKKPKSPQDYEQRLGEMTATLQRVQADFENYKKRVIQERESILRIAKTSVLADLLPALDNFDRAAMHLPKELESNSWAQGMSYIGTQLEQILDAMGVKKFQAEAGGTFDHTKHEALEHVESKKPDGIILEQVTPGYEVDGEIVRPAVVKVSKHNKGESK